MGPSVISLFCHLSVLSFGVFITTGTEQYFPLVSNYLIYYFSPIFCFFLSLLVWLLVPYLSGFISFELGLLFFLACTRLGVYTVIIAG
jgi:NADH-ubiquinone oxidoreductase chain 1